MKTFKQLSERSRYVDDDGSHEGSASSAADHIRPKDDGQVEKALKPRAKGEQDFANAHVKKKTLHPVATDLQFTGDTIKYVPHTVKVDKVRESFSDWSKLNARQD